jgi:hypothetical protein
MSRQDIQNVPPQSVFRHLGMGLPEMNHVDKK